jgi:hypothetical protein
MVQLARKVTVVMPPWAPRYERDSDPVWREKDDQYVALVTDAGHACGFNVLNIPAVLGLRQFHFADEMHVNASGVPIYTFSLISALKL